MADREKVMKGLECCLGSNDCDVEPKEDCPYKGMCLCAMALHLDVLALLKEQEEQIKTMHIAQNVIADYLIQPEIVRCKDCFYGEVEPDDNSYFFCTHPLHKLESHESSYFCADGEAKADE